MKTTTSICEPVPAASGDRKPPVAASARYEAYPSIAYESTGRLWVAYEEGGKGWGKDFGAYNTNGVAVYQGRSIRLRGFEPDGQVVETASDVGGVLPGFPSIHFNKAGLQKDFEKFDPDTENAKTAQARRELLATCRTRAIISPRLTVDASGRIWIAVRSSHHGVLEYLGNSVDRTSDLVRWQELVEPYLPEPLR